MIITLSISIIILIILLSLSIFAISKLTNMIYDINEQIEESLDILDKSYKNIDNVLKTPVFYDDPIVKQTLQAIKNSQNAILLVANKISYHENYDNNEDIAGEDESNE